MTLDYDLIRSNRTSICITVERDRRVVVRAPKRASEFAVCRAIQRKKLWIWSKLRDTHKYPVPVLHKEFVSGETFLFLGQHCELSLTHGEGDAVQLVDNQFKMPGNARHNGRELFRLWYLTRAKQQLPPRIRRIAAEMGVNYSRICIRDLKFRWGSCSPRGTLTFNWRAIQAPVTVVDYVIVHELAHVLQSNHSRDFWNIVAVHVPSWAKARMWLQKNGAHLEW